MSITPKNWTSFQHYKDRKPAWIKLHHALLDDYEFAALPVESRALAPLLWLLASEAENGEIDDDLAKLAFRLRMSTKEVAEALHPLLEAGFFVRVEGGLPEREKWPSRHIPQQLRTDILERDGHKCVACGSEDNLEIDHKTPVSKGGESVAENLQTLCRSCNRSKRVRTAEQFATQPKTQRSLETEEEGENKIEIEKPADAGSSGYVFESGVIKLNAKDFAQWSESFSKLDLRAELLSLTEWAQSQPKWFFAVAGALAKRNRDVGFRQVAAQRGAPVSASGQPYPDGII